MESKNLILVVSLVVVVFLAGSFVILGKQKLAGMVEKSGRLILNNPEIEITQGDTIEYPQYSNGSMPLDCCTEDWQRIRLEALSVGGQNTVCLFTHPRENGTVNLTYKNIKMKRAISFITGISDMMVGGQNSPVNMDIYVDSAFIQRITQPDVRGWSITEVSTDKYQNRLSDVKLVVSADNIAKRHFCFDAQTVE